MVGSASAGEALSQEASDPMMLMLWKLPTSVSPMNSSPLTVLETAITLVGRCEVVK